MRELSSLDAQLLFPESPASTGHVGALLLLDPGTAAGGALTLEDVRDLIEDRLHLAPSLRERVVEVPLGAGSPVWVDDPHFDLEFHTREIGLPAPGDASRLAEQVARFHALPLDRSRPLWELYLVHGVEGDGAALYAKFHHTGLDHITGAPLLTALLDSDSQPREVEDPAQSWQPSPLPDAPSLLANGLASTVARSTRLLGQLPTRLPPLAGAPTQVVSGMVGSVASAVAGAVTGRAGGRDLPVPPTPFNGHLTPHRRFAYASVDLEAVHTVTEGFNATVDEVAMAMIAGALRRWLLDHDALPSIPLVVAVPTPVHEDAGDPSLRSMMRVALPADEADPLTRLRAVAVAMREAEATFDPTPASLLQELSTAVPSAMSGWATRSLLRLASAPPPPFNLLVANAAGPQQPLYVAGARVTGMYAAAAMTELTGGMGVSMVTYDGSLDVGIVVCREMVPDVGRVAGYLRDALDELVALADA